MHVVCMHTSECLVLLYICTYILYIILVFNWYAVRYVPMYRHTFCLVHLRALPYTQYSPSINTCTQYTIVAILSLSTPISPELEDLIMRLLEKQPDLRLTIPEIRVSGQMGCCTILLLLCNVGFLNDFMKSYFNNVAYCLLPYRYMFTISLYVHCIPVCSLFTVSLCVHYILYRILYLL